mgnify:CR=1 FL=1
MKKTLLIFTLIFCSNVHAEWQNTSERYSKSYEKYLNATCPLKTDKMQHFVYFSRDREQIIHHPLLRNARFSGAQIRYSWRQLETAKGQYDFSSIQTDFDYLAKHGKQLFIQLQDATFNPKYKGVPDYLLTAEFDGGAIYQLEDSGEIEGWVAKRWNAKVRARFAALLQALGKQFDGKVAGINLQESAIGVSTKYDPSFSPTVYVQALKANMLSLEQAFPTSTTLQYANFMPGEWLPWEDEGYLKSIYQYGEEIGVGLAAPDLMVRRKGQLNHALAMMHENNFSVPLGIAIQDGNYVGQTNTLKVVKKRKNLVPLLHAFAQEFLRFDYMFWVNQAPYFEQDVLPCFNQNF